MFEWTLIISRNGDNFIDWEELKEALMSLHADPEVETWEIDELFNEADVNGDGVIDVEGRYVFNRFSNAILKLWI